jgi:hypothetical protein
MKRGSVLNRMSCMLLHNVVVTGKRTQGPMRRTLHVHMNDGWAETGKGTATAYCKVFR